MTDQEKIVKKLRLIINNLSSDINLSLIDLRFTYSGCDFKVSFNDTQNMDFKFFDGKIEGMLLEKYRSQQTEELYYEILNHMKKKTERKNEQAKKIFFERFDIK